MPLPIKNDTSQAQWAGDAQPAASKAVNRMPVASRAAQVLADPRWAAVERRDAEADGSFVFAVATTGVYCRPSCPARRPKPENVRFFALNAEAEAAGFRACKRCRPTAVSTAQKNAAAVECACRMIEAAERAPDLAALAEAAGMSPHHFHRVFRASVGVTPKAYALALRRRRAAESLKDAASVTDAIYEAGFQSSGRFYETVPAALGMAPARYRKGAAGVTIIYATADTSLGPIIVASTDKGICAIRFGASEAELVAELRAVFPAAALAPAGRAFEATLARVVAHVERPEGAFDLPLDIRGTAFQERVWAALRTVPPGRTASYGEIASRIGRPQAVRAVANACGANPVAVVVPCHRILRGNGDLGGYRWGVERKADLLARERAAKKA